MLQFLMIIDNVESRSKLELIYETYHKEMYFIAHDILKNTHDAQDAVQTSILKMITYIEKIDEVNCNKTKYLIVTIVRNTAIDIYRKKNKQPVIEIDDISELIQSNVPSMDELVIRISDAKMLAKNLAKLKIEYADVLTLKYYHEFDDKEIANALCISYENVRVRLCRAKNELKKIMKNDQEFDVYQRKCANER